MEALHVECSLRVHQACVVLVPEQCPVPPELFTGGASHEPATDSRVDDSFPHAGQVPPLDRMNDWLDNQLTV